MDSYVKQTLVPGCFGPLKINCVRYIHVLISAMLISVDSKWAAVFQSYYFIIKIIIMVKISNNITIKYNE